MNIKRILGLEKPEEKVARFKNNLELLRQLDVVGAAYSDEFAIQKSIIDGIDEIPEEKRGMVLKSFADFSKRHAKRVASACAKRMEIVKDQEEMLADPTVSLTLKGIVALAKAKDSYVQGKISRKAYFDVCKAITKAPVKYADVVVENENYEILILHRTEDYEPTGKVCIPGGHVDEGETFEEAALRELTEETGLIPDESKGILYLGEHKTRDAHIKYYKVWVKNYQPVTVDGEEHCFSEWIRYEEIPLKDFIFDQGRIVLKLLAGPTNYEKIQPILEAYDEGKATGLVVEKSLASMLKAMDIEAAKPVMPESMEGSTKCVVQVRDPKRMLERAMKSIQGCNSVFVNDTEVTFTTPMTVFETKYIGEPESNLLMDAEIVFNGADADMTKLLNELKYSVRQGGVKFRNAQEEFMSVNENGTDYVGNPIFLVYEK